MIAKGLEMRGIRYMVNNAMQGKYANAFPAEKDSSYTNV